LIGSYLTGTTNSRALFILLVLVLVLVVMVVVAIMKSVVTYLGWMLLSCPYLEVFSTDRDDIVVTYSHGLCIVVHSLAMNPGMMMMVTLN